MKNLKNSKKELIDRQSKGAYQNIINGQDVQKNSFNIF
jgi:hypothetical protein